MGPGFIGPWFMVDVRGNRWNYRPDLMPHNCDILEGRDKYGVNNGASIYLCIRRSTIKHNNCDCKLKFRPTRNAQKMEKVFKSYKHPYTVYADTLR